MRGATAPTDSSMRIAATADSSQPGSTVVSLLSSATKSQSTSRTSG
jgi:hypothetical protein